MGINFREFESILENKRGKEEISEEVLQDHLTMKGEEEAEPMEDDSLAKTVQVNRLVTDKFSLVSPKLILKISPSKL